MQKSLLRMPLLFYNQRDHDQLNRHLILPFLQTLSFSQIEPVGEKKKSSLATLLAQCDSKLEQTVLQIMHKQGLPLPKQMHKTLYDGNAPSPAPIFSTSLKSSSS